MRKHVLLFSALLLSCITVKAQLTKIWDEIYGGSDFDKMTTITPLKNGNLVMGGYSASGISGDKSEALHGSWDYWIVCADSNGNKLWDADFGGNDYEELSTIIQTKDGGLLVGGSTYSGIGGTKTQSSQGIYDYWIIKTDPAGNYQWDKRYGGSENDVLASICNTNDGGYLLAGSSESQATGDKTQNNWTGYYDYWVVKIDSMGTKLWDKHFGGTNIDKCYSAYQTSDHGYILSGYSESGISGDKSQPSWGYKDYWVVRIDSVGTMIWDKRFGSASDDNARAGVSDGHDGVVIGGFTSGGISGDKTQDTWGLSDYWLVHVDSIGNKVWDARFGGNLKENTYGSIFRSSDGGYISSGTSYSDISGNKTQDNLGVYQIWMVKCDANGNFVLDRTALMLGGEPHGYSLETAGGCFILGNYTGGSIGGDKVEYSQGEFDYWIVKYCPTELPVAVFTTADTTLCQGQCVTFNDASYNYPSAWSWWFPGGVPTFSTLQNPVICYNSAGPHDVRLIVANINGTDTMLHSAYITVLPQIPTPSIFQAGTLLTCTPAAGTYQWYFNYVAIPGATNQTYSAGQTGSYFVMVADSLEECTAISPSFSFNLPFTGFAAEDSMVCEKFCTNFFDLSSNNPVWWHWIFDEGTPSSSLQQNPTDICYDVPGIYDVTLITNDGYKYDTLTLQDYMTVFPTPPLPAITISGDTLMSSPSFAYQWLVNGVEIPGATNQLYLAAQSGVYTIITFTGDGCTAEVSIYFDLTSIGSLIPEKSFEVFPNPGSGIFLIKFQQVEIQPLTWFVSDVTGRIIPGVFSSDPHSPNNIILDLRALNDGLYFIHICNNDGCFVKKIIKHSPE